MATTMESFVYKTTLHCDIHLDVYRDDTESNPKPVIVWIHGGALINGSRSGRLDTFEKWYLSEGYTVASIDYRLAPETKLPQIIEDLEDALCWVREKGPEQINIDPNRIGVVGHSAGGYLTLMTGIQSPPPKAIVSFYGYSDITGDWYSKPDPFYCKQPRVSEEEAWRHVKGPPIAQRTESSKFYLYCRQNGLWPREVGGQDSNENPAFFTPYCPHLNLSPTYPPTLMLHGDQDTDVPHQQSVIMAKALTQAGIKNELKTFEGGGHGFDRNDIYENAARKEVQAFLKAHL